MWIGHKKKGIGGEGDRKVMVGGNGIGLRIEIGERVIPMGNQTPKLDEGRCHCYGLQFLLPFFFFTWIFPNLFFFFFLHKPFVVWDIIKNRIIWKGIKSFGMNFQKD